MLKFFKRKKSVPEDSLDGILQAALAERKRLLKCKPGLKKMQKRGFPYSGFSVRSDDFYNVVRNLY